MYIFIITIILVSIISLCFFKKRFWENRYLVLLISAGVAIVATLTTNYIIRGDLNTNVETIWEKPIDFYSINDSLTSDSSLITINEELNLENHRVSENDTTVNIKWTTILIYGDNDESLRKVGYFVNGDDKYEYLKTIYIAPSENDTTAYLVKKRQNYDSKSNWITRFSLPSIQTIKCFYIPPSQYACIPDSLIRELPF